MSNNHNSKLSHEAIETNNFLMIVLILIVLLFGGLVEIVPLFFQKSTTEPLKGVQPYTALQLAGRDVYQREGCYNCHSQMIRPFRSETERYGEYSKAGEFVYDHPFQWGSKRTGPDLAREGSKYPNSWHYNHMLDPTTMAPGSIMPAYDFLIEDDLDTSLTAAKINVMRKLGVPYDNDFDKIANQELVKQEILIADDLAKAGVKVAPNKEIVAIIAYLQRLGTDIKGEKVSSVK